MPRYLVKKNNSRSRGVLMERILSAIVQHQTERQIVLPGASPATAVNVIKQKYKNKLLDEINLESVFFSKFSPKVVIWQPFSLFQAKEQY